MDISDISISKPNSVILGGLLGSLLSLAFVEKLDKRQRAVSVVSGMIMAHYLAPLIAYLFTKGDYQETIGFLVGLFGMSICAAVFKAIKHVDLWALLKDRFERKG